MNNKFEVFELNEKDNLLSAAGKGMFNGAYKAYLVWGTVGLVCIGAGQLYKKINNDKVEIEGAVKE